MKTIILIFCLFFVQSMSLRAQDVSILVDGVSETVKASAFKDDIQSDISKYAGKYSMWYITDSEGGGADISEFTISIKGSQIIAAWRFYQNVDEKSMKMKPKALKNTSLENNTLKFEKIKDESGYFPQVDGHFVVLTTKIKKKLITKTGILFNDIFYERE